MRCVLLLLLLALAACGRGEGGGATLRADIVGTLDDPASPPRVALTGATQLGLVQFDGKGQIVPGLAASWRVVDQGRSLIFRLRETKWSDGRSVRAADVVQAFRRIVAAGSRNPLKPLLAGIDNAPAIIDGRAPAALLGVTAPLDMVVEVRLSSPDPAMLELLALPQAAIVRGDSRPPAIGAFRVADAGQRPLRLIRNQRYFDAVDTRLGGVVLSAAPDPAAAIARFVRGDSDLVAGDGIAGLEQARRLAPRGTLRTEPTWGSYAYLANSKRGPLADPQVRRALAMAVDRAGLVRTVFNRAEIVPLVSLVPPDAGTGPAAPVPDWAALDLPQRRALAAQLLAAAGFDAARPLRLTLLLPPGAEHAAVAAAVARDWAPDGVVLVVRQLAPRALRAALAAGAYDLALVERTAPAAQPLVFLRPLTCTGSAGNSCNARADALIDGARTLAGDARAAALAEAETALLADTPMIALFVPLRWALVSRRIDGWSANQAGRHPLAVLSLGD